MEEFNSDERFLVPDSDDDQNSKEPWDLVSGLEALTSLHQRGIFAQNEDRVALETMSSSHRNKSTVDSSESAADNPKRTTLAYDTVSSDNDSGVSHNQTVIERKVLEEKNQMDKQICSPSEHLRSLEFSQDVVLVPETMDSVEDQGQSPNVFYTAPFIVPDSPSQDAMEEEKSEKIDERQQEDELGFRLSSSMNTQNSSKIESQGLHLHFSQSQTESSPNSGSIEIKNVLFGNRDDISTTPIKDSASLLSCRKLTLKDAPPSPQLRDSLPKPSFPLPSQLQFSSESEEEDEADKTVKSGPKPGNGAGKQSTIHKPTDRLTKKQSKRQKLFVDTEEDQTANAPTKACVGGERSLCGENAGGSLDGLRQRPQASLVLIEDPESMVVSDEQTMAYEYDLAGDGCVENKIVDDPTSEKQGESETAEPAMKEVRRSKEGSQSQGEFDGFEEFEEEVTRGAESNLKEIEDLSAKKNENEEKQQKNTTSMSQQPVKGCVEDSPNAPSSQVLVNMPESTKIQEDASKSLREVSVVLEQNLTDPYHFQGSQSQNVADVSNLGFSERSRLTKSGSKAKAVKVMRKVLKKKFPPKTDQKSSSTDESSSKKPGKSAPLRRKMSAMKHGPKTKAKPQANTTRRMSDTEKKDVDGEQTASFTNLQSKSLAAEVGDASPPSLPPSAVVNEMPPPLVRGDSGRRGVSHSKNETSPQLSKKATVVSFQEQFPKVKSLAKEVLDPPTGGETERKTVREFKAIVVERETTIDILDDKGKILKQTITKEVIRTPIEPPWISTTIQVTERILSPNVSPSRSVSTLTSGDLADVSSSSLSRSMSSGSKGSNPSLDFCSQSYPTPAQRTLPLDTGVNKPGTSRGDESNKIGKRTSAVTSSTVGKPDNKRLSSGSNTGQDLFASPDQSLIPHMDGSHLDRAPSSSASTPVAVNPDLISVSAKPSEGLLVVASHESKMDKEIEIESVDKKGGEIDDDDEIGDIPMHEPSVQVEKAGNISKEIPTVPKSVRGKRKLSEKMERKPTPLQKTSRRERIKDGQEKSEADCGQASAESGVSTGFVVHDTAATATSNHPTSVLCEKATSSTMEVSDQLVVDLPGHKDGDNLVVDIKSRLLLGEQVMGKWTDGFFYPGVLKKLDSSNLRFQVKFDDGTQKCLGPEGLLMAKELPIGQSVMVMREDGFYECGMILAHSWTISEEDGSEKSLTYHVERDDGVTQKCQRESLLLSEDQAACLITDPDLSLAHDVLPVTVTKAGDISLDNLVEGKRHHKSKTDKTSDKKTSDKSLSVTAGDETPGVSHDTTVARSGRKRKVGPVATSTPTPKLTSKASHEGETPVKSAKLDSLGGVVSSPSTSRRSPRKTRQGLFGKKLSPVPGLFKGLTFLLTHVEKSAQQRQEEKWLLADSSLEDTSFDENQDESEGIHPFVKDQIHSLILAGGGRILDTYDTDEIQAVGPSTCYLVASEHQRTVKYLQALAGNLTIVSHQWILHSIDKQRLLGLKAFLLPAGISLQKRKLMECKSVSPQVVGQTVLVASSRTDFIQAWASILSLAKCHVATKFPVKASKADPGIDFVVSDPTCPAPVTRKCRSLDVPLVSSEWFAQCLINNCLVDHTSHDKYRHDYGTS